MARSNGRGVLFSLIATVPLVFLAGAFTPARGQDQLLEEVATAVRNASSQSGIARPDLEGRLVNGDDFEYLVPLASRNLKAIQFASNWGLVALDGGFIRRFRSDGIELTTDGFPIACTSIGGASANSKFATCTGFVALQDGSLHVAGQTKGKKFEIWAYEPESQTSLLKATGTPLIEDMDRDEGATAGDRLGPGYYAVGNRKNLYFFPAGNEQNYATVASFKGRALLDGVTIVGPNVLAVFDNGDLVALDAKSGVQKWTKQLLPRCPGTTQKYAIRGTPGDRVFVTNFACNSVSILTGDLAAGSSIEEQVLTLDDPSLVSPSALTWQEGVSGSWDDECNTPDGCQIGKQAGQATVANVSLLPIFNIDSSYIMYQFLLDDCRWSGAPNCPIVNVGESDPSKQVLDLSALMEQALPGFTELVGLQDQMTIPGWARAEEYYPKTGGGYTFNDWKFYVFFADTPANFTRTFNFEVELDLLRPPGSNDPCIDNLPKGSSLDQVLEQGLTLYVTETYPTIDRGSPLGKYSGTLSDAFCGTKGSVGTRWSAFVAGMELLPAFTYVDGQVSVGSTPNPRAFSELSQLVMDELKDARHELLCSAFSYRGPDGTTVTAGPLLYLDPTDCSLIEGELNKIDTFLGSCRSAAEDPKGSAGNENCQSFVSQVNKLAGLLDTDISWPDPNDPDNLDLLRPNYEGEFRARLANLRWVVTNWFLPSIPADGF